MLGHYGLVNLNVASHGGCWALALNIHLCFSVGRRGGAVGSHSVNTGLAWGLSPCSLHVLLRSVWGFFSFLPQSKTCRVSVKLAGDSKSTVGVNVRVNGCCSLHFVISWRLVQVLPSLSPNVQPPP